MREIGNKLNVADFKQICDVRVFLKAGRNIICQFVQLRFNNGKCPVMECRGRIKKVIVL